MAGFLDPYQQSLQDYLLQGDYGSVLRLLMQNRANDQVGSPTGFASDYTSQVGSRSGLLGTVFEVLTGINPKFFAGDTNVDQFQNVFRSYFSPGNKANPSTANYQRQALQQLFSNSEGARSYYNSLFPDNGTAGTVDNAYQKIAQQVAALLSNRYSSTALQSMFGGSALNRMIDEFRAKQASDPSMDFLGYMYSLYGKYLPPIDRQKTPTSTTKPTPTKPVVDEMKPGDTKTPIMNRNTGPENNPILSSQTDWENMRKQKPLKFLGAV